MYIKTHFSILSPPKCRFQAVSWVLPGKEYFLLDFLMVAQLRNLVQAQIINQNFSVYILKV